VNEYVKEHNQIPEVRIRKRLRQHLRKVFNKYIKDHKKIRSRHYGISWQKIIDNLKPFPTGISNYHIDHITPLSSFDFINSDGSINENEIRIAFSPKNHQWLLAHDNISKGNKIIIQSQISRYTPEDQE